MRIEDWFAVAIRVFGITLLVTGLGLLIDSLLLKLGYFFLPDTHPAYYLIYGGAQVLGGLYLIRGAPSLVSFAFPRNDDGEIDADEE